MGHIRLGNLPRTKKWQQVVNLIGTGAESLPVASATLDAAKDGFAQASKDPALIFSLFLLTQVPQCARSEAFGSALNALGLSVSTTPSLPEILGSFSDAIDKHVQETGGRTDLGEMAQMAAVETLAQIVDERTRGLFEATPEIIQDSFRGLGTKKQFSTLARTFFSRLTERYLKYFLSRELSNHVGEGRRFTTLHTKQEFERALGTHCWEASKILEEFSGGWYSKQTFQGGITERKARHFLSYALTKIEDELHQGARSG
jgi:hypothetical protein